MALGGKVVGFFGDTSQMADLKRVLKPALDSAGAAHWTWSVWSYPPAFDVMLLNTDCFASPQKVEEHFHFYRRGSNVIMVGGGHPEAIPWTEPVRIAEQVQRSFRGKQRVAA
jgi:hypothetical protein